MAGNRQHILPRFLLKGFASRVERKGIYTWVYSKERGPFETNIINVGVEKYFYGGDGELNVDDDITDFEGEYAPLLDELREHEGQVEISDPRIANLITHLVVRTKHIRESLRESSEFMIQKISKHLSDFANLKAAMLSQAGIKEFKKTLKDMQASRSVRRKSQKLAKRILPGLIDANQNKMKLLYQNIFETVINSLQEW
jgi:hypothetical protein